MSTAAAWILGLHLATAHSNHALEPLNPGVYVRTPDGITAGVLRNSYGRTSVYGGYTLQTEGGHLALTLGAITGYPARPVLPLVVPSVRIPLAQAAALRLSLLPRAPSVGSGVGLHASVEISF